MALFVHLAVVLLFIALAVVFWSGKGTSLIAGYNTACEEERMQTDEKKLCRFMSKLMLALALCWLVAASSELFQNTALLWTGIALFLVVIVAGLIYANTGNRFEKDQ